MSDRDSGIWANLAGTFDLPAPEDGRDEAEAIIAQREKRPAGWRGKKEIDVHPDTQFVEELVIQVLRGNDQAAIAKLRARGIEDGIATNARAEPLDLDSLPVASVAGLDTRTVEYLDRAGLIYAADVLAKTPQELRNLCLSWAQIEKVQQAMRKLTIGRIDGTG